MTVILVRVMHSLVNTDMEGSQAGQLLVRQSKLAIRQVRRDFLKSKADCCCLHAKKSSGSYPSLVLIVRLHYVNVRVVRLLYQECCPLWLDLTY